MKDIILYLTKRPRITEINGLMNRKFLEERIGRKDGKIGQLSQTNGNYSTPWIEKKLNLLHSYINKMYLKANASLEKIYKEIHTHNTNYKLLSKNNENDKIMLKGEEVQRQASLKANKALLSEKEKKEILIKMSEIRGLIDTVDKALLHNIERSEKIFYSHIFAYWKGIITTTSDELPANPGFTINEVRGQKVYEKHLNEMRSIFNDIFV